MFQRRSNKDFRISKIKTGVFWPNGGVFFLKKEIPYENKINITSNSENRPENSSIGVDLGHVF
jgi:hypothetical protein